MEYAPSPKAAHNRRNRPPGQLYGDGSIQTADPDMRLVRGNIWVTIAVATKARRWGWRTERTMGVGIDLALVSR